MDADTGVAADPEAGAPDPEASPDDAGDAAGVEAVAPPPPPVAVLLLLVVAPDGVPSPAGDPPAAEGVEGADSGAGGV